MAKKAKTKTEKLLKAIEKRGGMTRKQMVQFLLGLDNCQYIPNEDRGTYNATLYGTSSRKGILERFCKADRSGSYPVYKVKKTYNSPFTVSR